MEFAKLLIIGLIIFTALYIFFGGFQFTGEMGGPGYRWLPSSRNITIPEGGGETVIKGPSGKFVGTTEVEDFRHITLSSEEFTVSYLAGRETLVSAENIEVKNGLFAYKKFERSFSIEDVDSLVEPKIYGEIEDTNLYGKLIIALNGQKIFSDYVRPGETFEVKINKSLFKKDNVLEIAPQSSSWRLWAPTVYIIKKLELSSEFYGEISQTFDFNVAEEEYPTTLGRIILNVDKIDGSGNLMVWVNGELVFNATPTSRQWIEFDGSLLRKGKNTIEMAASRGVEFTISYAEIIIFWKRSASETLEIPFTLTSSQYKRLPGKIKFKIEKVFGSPTSLLAKIEDPNGNTHSVVVQGVLQEGKTVSIDLQKDYVDIGKNKVILSVTGDGGYTITDFRIEV